MILREVADVRLVPPLHLAGVRAQTTVVSGPCEPTPAAAAEGYATIPGARHVVLPNTGEFGMVEETAAFQATVRHALFRP